MASGPPQVGPTRLFPRRSAKDAETGATIRIVKPRRAAGTVLLVVIAGVSLSGCVIASSSGPTKTAALGHVTGLAYPCVGISAVMGTPVTVTLRIGSHVVASQTVRYPHLFRFSARPGRYVLSSSAQTSRPHAAVIRAESTIRIDLNTSCK